MHVSCVLYTVLLESRAVRSISQQSIQWPSIVFHLHQKLSGRLKEPAASLFSSALPICRQSALPISRYQSVNLQGKCKTTPDAAPFSPAILMGRFGLYYLSIFSIKKQRNGDSYYWSAVSPVIVSIQFTLFFFTLLLITSLSYKFFCTLCHILFA